MRVELFGDSTAVRDSDAAMGSSYHYVPNIHALYFGPAECARHTFPSLADDEEGSYLVVDDVQASMGQTPLIIEQAVEELLDLRPGIEAFLLCSACQTAFLGLDLEGVCRALHEKTGKFFGHLEANRMLAENMPGPLRRNVPGGDRFHSRLSFVRMIGQVIDDAQVACESSQQGTGIFVLGEVSLAAENDLHAIARAAGLSWVKSLGDCASFGDFTLLADARVVIVDSIAWQEAGDYLRDEIGMQVLYAPTSYSLEENGRYMDELEHMLGIRLGSADDLGRRADAIEQLERCVAACSGHSLEIDLRAVVRPYSCLAALLQAGFTIESVMLSPSRVWHVEPDDAAAYDWLKAVHPDLVDEARRQAKRAGRRRSHAGLSTEASYWGYSSTLELCEQIMSAVKNSTEENS